MSEFVKCKGCSFERKYYGYCYNCEIIELKEEREKLKSQLKDAEEVIDTYVPISSWGFAKNYRDRYPKKDLK